MEYEDNTHIIEHDGLENDGTIANLRLNTDPLIRKYEMKLKSIEEHNIKNPHTGEWEIKYIVPYGVKPLCNAQGVNSLIAYVETQVSPHTAQASYDQKVWNRMTAETIRTVTMDIISNRVIYQIEPTNLNMIIMMACQLVEKYSSRAVNDGERKSFGRNSIRESNVQQSRGMLQRQRRNEEVY